MIEFAPTLGEDALIGRAPVRPRGRSSSSSINNHSISSKQQRSSSITNSPDPSIITSDAAEPTAAGSRGANCVVMAEPVTRRPPRRTSTRDRGYRSAQRQETNQSHRSSIIISKSKNAIGARALYSPLSPPVSSTPGSFIRPRWLLTEKYTEGLHPERPARGAVLYTGQSRPCIEHKGQAGIWGSHSYGPLLTSPSPQHRSEPEFRCQWVGLDAPWSYWARVRTKSPLEPL